MINRPWKQITKEDIESLVIEGIPESHTLDYKQEMPNDSSKSKLDFLADIVAFANASGGDLIFGVEEQRVEGKPTAIPQGFRKLRIAGTWDEAKRRLESLIRTGIDPTLSVQMDSFDSLPEGPVFIVRVPPSFAVPHMVTLYTKDQMRPQFYKRHNGGNHPMDAGEIRAAFTLSETRIERLRHFREERLSLINAQNDSVPPIPGSGARYTLHLLPVTAFDPSASVDISRLHGRDWGSIPSLADCGRPYGYFNFEGYLLNCHGGNDNNTLSAYVQVFRNGSIEAGKALVYESYIANDVELAIINRTKALLSIQQELGVEPTLFVMLSFFGVKDCPVILPPNASYSGTSHRIDRNFLPLPECMIQDFDTPVEKALRPAFDALYQSAGMPRSFNYDEAGNWIGLQVG